MSNIHPTIEKCLEPFLPKAKRLTREDNMKKFELTSEFIIVNDIKLFRIKALIDFGIFKKDDLSGYLEKERNLDHDGDAWVYNHARVSGDAWDKSPLQIQGKKHFFNISREGYLKIGCFEYDLPYWAKNYKKIGEYNGYTDGEIAEYKLYIDLAVKLSKIKS